MSLRTLAACATFLASSLALPAFAAVSFFSSGAEGWTAAGDVEGSLTWSPTGGNPDGHVSIDDLTTGGVTYFVAPAPFLGNQTSAIDTSLMFDLRQVYPGGPNQFDDEDVILQGGGLTLAYDLPANPLNGAWTSFAVPLSAASWRVGTLAGPVATSGQFSAVMASLAGLRIRAEYQTGADVGSLDNVVLVPEPDAAALVVVGGIFLLLALRRRSGHARD